MASKKILVQLDIQAASNLTSPLSGFVGFSAKADGLYQKIGTAPELRLLTSADVQNAILANGSITGAVSQAQIFTMGVKLYNLTQGYIPYASGATKLLSNSPINTDGVNVGIGATNPGAKLDVVGDFKLSGSIGMGTVPDLNNLLFMSKTFDGSTTQSGIKQWIFSSPTSNSTNDVYGLNMSARKSGNFNLNTVIGISSIASNQGNGLLGNAYSYKSTVSLFGTGNTGTIGSGYNYFASGPGRDAGNTGSITNMFGLRIVNQGASYVTNAYGLYIDTQTGATTSNYNIYSVGGVNYFGGNVGIGTTPNQQLEITKNFRLPSTTGTTPYGIIYKGASPFIHDFNYGNNGTVTTAGGNTFVGLNAGNFTMGSTATQNYNSSFNTGIGVYSLFSNTTGNSNTAIGYQSLYFNTTGYNNIGIGYNSLYSNTTGFNNTAISVNSLFSNTTGYNNTAIGLHSLYSNNTGDSNTAIGLNSLYNNTTGYNNTAIGFQSLFFNISGYNNAAIGLNSLYNNTTGNSNSAIGVYSLIYNTTGYNNTAIGFNAGSYIADGTTGRTTGNHGLYLGLNSKASTDGTNNEIVIGYNAIGAGSNKTVIGNSSVTDTYFGSSTGASKLWASALNLSGLTASKVVFTDGSKNLTSAGIGTSSQFIKGDGSLDYNTYLTSSSATRIGSNTYSYLSGDIVLQGSGKIFVNQTGQFITVNSYGYTKEDVGLSNVTNNAQWHNGNHPTTIAGYGITDALTVSGLTTNYIPKWNGTTFVNGPLITNSINTLVYTNASIVSNLAMEAPRISLADNSSNAGQSYIGFDRFTENSNILLIGAGYDQGYISILPENEDGLNVMIGSMSGARDLYVTGGTSTSSIALRSGAVTGYYLKCINTNGVAEWAPVTASQIYKGTWNASTNTPYLSNGSGTAGWYYRVTTAGTFNSVAYSVGDDIIYNGSIWERIPGAGYSLQTASTTILGGVKIDGTSVKLNASNQLYVSTNYEAPLTFTNGLSRTGNTVSFSSSLSEFVPYSGATMDVDLGSRRLTVNNICVTLGSGSGRFLMDVTGQGHAAWSNLPVASSTDIGAVKVGYGLYVNVDTGSLAVDTMYFVPYTGASKDVNLGSRSIFAYDFILYSDINLKCNIESIPKHRIDIDYKQFEYKTNEGEKRYGVIAQELLSIAPEFVVKNGDYYAVKYTDLLVYEIVQLKEEIKELKSMLCR